MTVSNWVVRRDGTAHQLLTADGEWGTMDEAHWFETEDEARAATVPEGTTGTPIQVHPDTPSET